MTAEITKGTRVYCVGAWGQPSIPETSVCFSQLKEEKTLGGREYSRVLCQHEVNIKETEVVRSSSSWPDFNVISYSDQTVEAQ